MRAVAERARQLAAGRALPSLTGTLLLAVIVAVAAAHAQEVPEAPEPPPAEISEAPVVAAPEVPRVEVHRKRPPQDRQVSVGSGLTVEADEVTREVTTVGGPLTVKGEVLGNATAVWGDLRIDGKVTGDAVAFGGDVFLGPRARVLGDLVCIGGEIEREPGAEVLGEISEIELGSKLRFGWWPRYGGGDWSPAHSRGQGFGLGFLGDLFHSPFKRVMDLFWGVFGLMVVSLLACLVLLLAPGPVERVSARLTAEPWKSGLVGLLVQILFFPLLVLTIVILCISIIGIPLLLLVPFVVLAACVLAFFGYTGAAYAVGRLAERRFGWRLENPYLAILAGVLMVQAWALLADAVKIGGGPLKILGLMIALFGWLVGYGAWTTGLGAAVLTRFGTAEGWGPRAAPPPLPAVPVAPSAGEGADSGDPPVGP